MAAERPPRGDLVERLVADLRPVRPRKLWRDALLLAGFASLEMLLVVGLIAPRHDLAEAMGGPMFWWKLLSCAGITVAGAAALLVTLSPETKADAGRRWIIGVSALALLVGLALAIIGSLPIALQHMLDWREGLACVAVVELQALPMLAATAWLARRSAPPDPRAAAFAAGLASAAWGAAAFVWWCPHDDLLYTIVWYGLALVIGGGAAWALLPRYLRW